MNTTKNISMGGYAFIVEEDAYARLKAYTEAVQDNLSGAPGADEMMSDIEVRIAEIFREIMGRREVVINEDVTKMIERMGDPDVYVQDDADKKERKTSSHEHVEKRIHRDPENKILGGVCGGLAAYFDADPVWFRLGFALSFIFYGTGLMLYIILWAVVPEAKTRTQKLQMRGKRPDINNIKNSIRSEFNQVGENLKSGADKSIKDGASRVSDVVSEVFTQIFYIIGKIFQVIFKMLAGILSVLSFAFLVFLIVLLLRGSDSIHLVGNEVNVDDSFGVIPHLFASNVEAGLFCFFLFIFLAVPTVALLANAIRFLANIKTKTSKWVGLSSAGIWVIATAGLMYMGIKLGMEFSSHANGNTEQVISVPQGKVLKLRMGERPKDVSGFMMSDIMFDIRESSDSFFRLRITKEAAGRTQKEAERRQESIIYNPIITDSVITFPELFVLPKGETIRAQSVSVDLFVPINGTVYIESRMQQLMRWVENVQGYHMSEMTNKYWVMTDRGLSCQGCKIPEPEPDTLEEFQAPVPDAPDPPATIKNNNK